MVMTTGPGENARRLMDEVAEFVADGGSIAGAGRKLEISQSYASLLWQQICKGMGMQAR